MKSHLSKAKWKRCNSSAQARCDKANKHKNMAITVDSADYNHG